MTDWDAAATALNGGAAVAEACAVGNLSWAQSRRLIERWADTWTELVDGLAGARILLIEDVPGRSSLQLAEVAGLIGMAESDPSRGAFRQALLRPSPGTGVVAPLGDLLARPGSWDVIVLGPSASQTWKGLGVGPGLIGRLEAALSAGGRVVIVADNRSSPLRAVDGVARTGSGRGGSWRLSTIDALLSRTGLRRRQVFGLLRSSLAPVLAFDLEAPRAAAAVLESATARQRGPKLALTRALGAMVANGLAEWGVPAWLIVASRTGDDWVDDPHRPTGRVGLAHSTESSKILRGEPPQVVDKWYSTRAAAEAEMSALRDLEEAGLDVAPRVVASLGERRARLSWIGGTSLNASQLAGTDLLRWVERAAQILGTIHRATRVPGNGDEVLVHGDFTLANCLGDGDRISGVIDWSGSRRGEARIDLDLLVRNAVLHARPGSARLGELEAAARTAYSSGGAG